MDEQHPMKYDAKTILVSSLKKNHCKNIYKWGKKLVEKIDLVQQDLNGILNIEFVVITPDAIGIQLSKAGIFLAQLKELICHYVPTCKI